MAKDIEEFLRMAAARRQQQQMAQQQAARGGAAAAGPGAAAGGQAAAARRAAAAQPEVPANVPEPTRRLVKSLRELDQEDVVEARAIEPSRKAPAAERRPRAPRGQTRPVSPTVRRVATEQQDYHAKFDADAADRDAGKANYSMSAYLELLYSPRNLQQAIILNEILQPPISMRRTR